MRKTSKRQEHAETVEILNFYSTALLDAIENASDLEELKRERLRLLNLSLGGRETMLAAARKYFAEVAS